MKSGFDAPPRKIEVVCKNCCNKEVFLLDSVKMNIRGYFNIHNLKASFIREKCPKCGCNKWDEYLRGDFREFGTH